MKKSPTRFEWNKVTPVSKYIAMILFIALPFVGFLLGMRYQQLISVTPPATKTTTTQYSGGLVNPASVYCQKQGGNSKIITAKDGSQTGQCSFSGGRICDEWEFFRTKVCK